MSFPGGENTSQVKPTELLSVNVCELFSLTPRQTPTVSALPLLRAGGGHALSADALAHLAASSVPSVWAGAACLPWHPPRSCKNTALQHFLLFPNFPPLFVILQATPWCAFVIYRNVISQRGFRMPSRGRGEGETEPTA